jgi:hypothetical protein
VYYWIVLCILLRCCLIRLVLPKIYYLIFLLWSQLKQQLWLFFCLLILLIWLCLKFIYTLILLWTTQKGISNALHKVGKNNTVSMGSTSLAIITNFAFFCSIKYVMWFNPYLRVTGLSVLVFCSLICFFAKFFNLSFFCFLVSGTYFVKILNKVLACMSKKIIKY